MTAKNLYPVGLVVQPVDNPGLEMVIEEVRLRANEVWYMCVYWIDGKQMDQLIPEWRIARQ